MWFAQGSREKQGPKPLLSTWRRCMLTRVSSVCVFTNGVTFCYNILCWLKLANRLFKTSHMLCSVATTKCGSLWPQDKWFMISKWECYHLLYRVSWIRSVIDQLTQGRPRCTSGLFKISCVPFSVRKRQLLSWQRPPNDFLCDQWLPQYI